MLTAKKLTVWINFSPWEEIKMLKPIYSVSFYISFKCVLAYGKCSIHFTKCLCLVYSEHDLKITLDIITFKVIITKANNLTLHDNFFIG